MKLTLLILYLFTTFFNSNSFEIQDDKFKKVEITALEFILTEESLRLYKDMSDSEKETWSLRFWRTMDPSPSTEINEYYEEFRGRLQFVYDNYHSITETRI